MTRTTARKLLLGLFLAAFIILLGLFNATKPRILVLHSFQSNDPWVGELNRGIQKVLKDNRNPVTVKYHYLDVLAQTDPNRLKVAVTGAHQAIARQSPDLLIAVDDEANELVARQYAGKKGPRIVSLATLLPPESYGYRGAANVSGVSEALPLEALKDAVMTIRSGRPARVAVLAMDDPTGRAELQQAVSHTWRPHHLAAVHSGNSFEGWQRFAGQMADKADILLVLSYDGLYRSPDNRTAVTAKEVVAWLEQHAKPLPISICPTYTHDGGGLSLSPAPADFGRQGMQMALAWIAAPAGSAPPPFTTSEHFSVGIRQTRLAARGVTLPLIYREAARQADAYFP